MSTNQIKKKGRRLGSKNKLGSKAPGPKPAHLVNQTFLDFPIVAEEAESSTTGRSQHSSFFSTAVLQGFESAGSGEINVYPNEEVIFILKYWYYFFIWIFILLTVERSSTESKPCQSKCY